MARPPRPWIVTPHDPIQKLESNLWAVDGDVPGMKLRRRMVIVRRADGTLLFYNAIPLRDNELAEVAAWGKPAVLIIPNSFHCMDARAFRERLQLKLYCGRLAAARVGKVAPVDGHLEDFPADATVSVALVAGTKQGEAAMTVKSGERTSIVFSDAFMNVARSTGILTTLMRTAGGPKCPPLFRFAFVKDKKAVRADLERLADTTGLVRLVPSHGDILENDAPGTLRRIAARDL